MADWYLVADDIYARDLWNEVPLDWSDPAGEKIWVYAREFVDAKSLASGALEKPAVIYLQGGPGGSGNRPIARDKFFSAALKRFRVVMPDQRGTGRSTPLSSSDFAELDAKEAARRLALHRADSIIKDHEALRETHFGGNPWWSIGQSYGGFLTLHYLSVAPDALVASAITGGIPGITRDAADVYRVTFPRVKEKNRRFYERFPHLVDRVAKIADMLQASEVLLPSGDRLSVKRFQTLGLDLGMQVGFDRMHWILDTAFQDREETVLSQSFLYEIEAATSFATNPLFIALHESIYGTGPANWAAERERYAHPEFDQGSRPLYFTGEMVFPWMLEEVTPLKGFKAGVDLLASEPWHLEPYDLEQLAKNRVPVEAAVYLDDMYVDSDYSLETAALVPGLETWVTNEFEHDGIRMGDVAERLFTRLEIRLAQNS